MNPRKVNWLFLSTLISEALVTVLLIVAGDRLQFGIITSLMISQLIIFLPTVAFLLLTRTKPGELIAHGRMRISVSLLVVAFTFLCMPLIVTVNAFSMLFVENEVVNLQSALTGVPGWLMLLMIGVIGPLNEEFVFRGVIYHGYRRSGKIIEATLLSALLFGLTHLNFNQMSYAILVGVVGVLLIEGTGSIYYSMLFHICINVTNVLQMIFAGNEAQMTQQQREAYIVEATNMPYKQALCVSIAVYAVIACFTTAIAGCIYYLILKLTNRVGHMHIIFSRKKEKIQNRQMKLISGPLIFSVLLCLIYMIFDVIMT